MSADRWATANWEVWWALQEDVLRQTGHLHFEGEIAQRMWARAARGAA